MASISSVDRFMEQSDRFIEVAGRSLVSPIVNMGERFAVPLEPVVIRDIRNISQNERDNLCDAYNSDEGVAHFVVLKPNDDPHTQHPLFSIVESIRDRLNLHHPLVHPLEGHPEAVKRFGPPDATYKVYDLPKDGITGYREVAETSEFFAMHHDGLGSAGTVQTAVLYCDSPPLWGGFTFFQNIVRVALELARVDVEAFKSAFLPDALTIIRPRGKGAIKIVTPVLFVNEDDRAESTFREASGEYIVRWKDDSEPLQRAREFFTRYARPFANGSSFVHFARSGQGCFIRNEVVAHSRTAFIDSPEIGATRVLSRKWYMTKENHAIYKHVPGMIISKDYGELFPEYFGSEMIEGEWLYNSSTDVNERVR